MLVGLDTEYTFTRVRRISGRPEPDVTTGRPVCACLAFEDGRELKFTDNWPALGEIINDPGHTIVVHGAQSEMRFCRMVGIQFPTRYIDTLLLGVLLAHASAFQPDGGAYAQAALAKLAPRFGIPFVSAGDKDVIRESILYGRHVADFGMPRVLDYCLADARACLRLAGPLVHKVNQVCGPNAARNLEQLYQPYAQAMAEVEARGMRFDQRKWEQLLELAPRYRERHLRVMRAVGYDHDGEGLGSRGFGRIIRRLGLDRGWPRTPTGQLRTREADLKDHRHLHPAIRAAHRLVQFDSLTGQRLGERVDRDGRLRCSILPYAQRSSRNSTVRPNLTGLPGELRPLLLPDEGCRFVPFDFSQQEPGVAGALSEDKGLMRDFACGDVYTNIGRQIGLVTPVMSPEAVRTVRNEVLKPLTLSLLYGKGAPALARDLGCSVLEANAHLHRFEAEYPRLFAFLRTYVSTSLCRGWAENVIGFRAAFTVTDPGQRTHVERSCQNFPIQSSAAACFQITGLHLADYGADIRLPLHDAYLLNVPDEPRAIADAFEQLDAAAEAATSQLFPGLALKRDIVVLDRFAKDEKVDSLDRLIKSLKNEDKPCPVG